MACEKHQPRDLADDFYWRYVHGRRIPGLPEIASWLDSQGLSKEEIDELMSEVARLAEEEKGNFGREYRYFPAENSPIRRGF